jgi:hypothetical protein
MMRLLASYVMRGRSQAVMATTLLGVLSLLMAPLSILSSAVVALVALRRGGREGLLVAVLATLACALLALLSQGNLAPALGFFALLWLPAWFLGSLLRASRSLALALQGALLLGVALIVAYYAQSADPVAEWRDLLEPFSQRLVDSQLILEPQRAELVERLALWMTGILAAVYQLQLMASLLLARWWQAMLYNPGGFRQEFHGLRLHRLLAYGGLPVLLLALLTEHDGAGQVVDYAAMLLVTAFFVQGLALVHGLVGKMGANPGWLVAMYMLLFLAMPHMVALLFIAGYADAWFDFRARFRARDRTG